MFGRKKHPRNMSDQELAAALGKEADKISRQGFKSEVVYGKYGAARLHNREVIRNAKHALLEGDRQPAIDFLSSK